MVGNGVMVGDGAAVGNGVERPGRTGLYCVYLSGLEPVWFGTR